MLAGCTSAADLCCCDCRAEPNAFTYSALIKAMSEHDRLDLAEQLFGKLNGARPGSSLGRVSAGTSSSQEGVSSSPEPAVQVRLCASSCACCSTGCRSA